MNIAIFTPNKNPYSETFIQAHKEYLRGKVFYYYGSGLNTRLEDAPPLGTKMDKLRLKIVQKLGNKEPSYIKKELIIRSLKKNKIDVVLAEYATHAHQILPMVKKLDLPMVVHFHGFDASAHKVITSHANYKSVFAYAKKIIAVSRKMEQMLLEIGCPREKLVYNVYGPRPEFGQLIPNYSKKQFVAIGRFTDKKAPYYVILALKKVVEQFPDVHLVFAGKGILMGATTNLARYYGLENYVTFSGVVSPVQFREILQNSRAFIQHSITAPSGDMEGTPLAILEASSAGLPVISTYHAGIPDVVLHGQTGLLCEEHDVDTMAAYMIQLLEDDFLVQKMGTAGKARIEKHFTLKRHIDALQRILESVVNE